MTPVGSRLGAVLAILLVAGCARTPFDEHLRAGRWSDAAAAFAADSTRPYGARTLRRVAHLHAEPDSATWDPQRAAMLLALARSRGGRPVPADVRLEAVLTRMVAERDDREAREGALRALLALAERDADSVRAAHARLLDRVVAQEEERALLHRLIARLEADLRDREAQIVALRAELDSLKAIDLAPPSRSPPSLP